MFKNKNKLKKNSYGDPSPYPCNFKIFVFYMSFSGKIKIKLKKKLQNGVPLHLKIKSFICYPISMKLCVKPLFKAIMTVVPQLASMPLLLIYICVHYYFLQLGEDNDFSKMENSEAINFLEISMNVKHDEDGKSISFIIQSIIVIFYYWYLILTVFKLYCKRLQV